MSAAEGGCGCRLTEEGAGGGVECAGDVVEGDVEEEGEERGKVFGRCGLGCGVVE